MVVLRCIMIVFGGENDSPLSQEVYRLEPKAKPFVW